MRFVITVFFALLLWGYVSFSAGDVGISKWISAACLLIVGLIIQWFYTRLVNSHFDFVGLPDSVRVRLRDDRGIVPLWIAGTGIIARAFMVAGGILPLVEVAGCIVRGTAGP